MTLTPEQRADVERQRRENPDARITIKSTPEQAAAYRLAVEEEEAGRAANSAHARRLFAALEEPGFSGDLRRAIAAALRPPEELARDLGISVELLSDFLAGDAPLPLEVVDRVVTLLRLKLVMETPQ